MKHINWLMGFGLFFFIGSAYGFGGGRSSPPPVPTPPPTQFGTLVQLGMDYSTTAEMDTGLTALAEAGVRVIRLPVQLKTETGWILPNSPEGKSIVDELEAFVSRATAKGMTIVFTIKPSLDGDGTPKRPPVMDRLNEWKKFIRTLVNIFSSRVRYWQFGNEMNHLQEWSGTPAEFVEFMKASYKAVKDASPASQVILGGLAAGDVIKTGGVNPNAAEYFKSLADAGVLPWCDLVDFHVYKEIESYDATITAFRQAMSANGGLTRPIWITESGYSGERKWYANAPEDVVCSQVVERLTLPASLGVPTILWSRSYDKGTGANQGPRGMMDAQGGKKYIYTCFQRTAQMLEGSHFDRKIAGQPGDQLLVFEGEKHTVLVAWTDGASRIMTIPNTKKAKVVSATGRPVNFTLVNKTLTFTLGSEPVIIRSSEKWEP